MSAVLERQNATRVDLNAVSALRIICDATIRVWPPRSMCYCLCILDGANILTLQQS